MHVFFWSDIKKGKFRKVWRVLSNKSSEQQQKNRSSVTLLKAKLLDKYFEHVQNSSNKVACCCDSLKEIENYCDYQMTFWRVFGECCPLINCSPERHYFTKLYIGTTFIFYFPNTRETCTSICKKAYNSKKPDFTDLLPTWLWLDLV